MTTSLLGDVLSACSARLSDESLRSPLKENGGEGRKGEDERVGAALRWLIGGFLAADVADVRAAVVAGVGVEDFAVVAGLGDAEAIASANDGSGVEDGDDKVFGFFATAEESKDTVVGVVGVNPFEAVPVEFDFVERRLGRVELV